MLPNLSHVWVVFNILIFAGVNGPFYGAGPGALYVVVLGIRWADDKAQALIAIFRHHPLGELRIQMHTFYY